MSASVFAFALLSLFSCFIFSTIYMSLSVMRKQYTSSISCSLNAPWSSKQLFLSYDLSSSSCLVRISLSSYRVSIYASHTSQIWDSESNFNLSRNFTSSSKLSISSCRFLFYSLIGPMSFFIYLVCLRNISVYIYYWFL